MFFAIMSIVLLIAGALLLARPPALVTAQIGATGGRAAGLVVAILGVVCFASMSFVSCDKDQICTMNRIYMAADLPTGQIIAENGQKGPQSEILGPGFHVSPFINFFYDIGTEPVFDVPEAHYGLLVARDGNSLRPGQFLADEWAAGTEDQMVDATHFLTTTGQKGPQLNVLKPGKYRINPYLWTVEAQPAIDVATGFVAVIRSNVQTASDEVCSKTVEEVVVPVAAVADATDGIVDDDDLDGDTDDNSDGTATPTVAAALVVGTGGEVATPIVPKGCIGVWDEALLPGRYYLNNRAYVPTLIPTRLITWAYKGGYEKKEIELIVDGEGTITQAAPTSTTVARPEGAADDAITVRVEGWEFPVEVRAVVQVTPENAPRVVASIGTLADVENRIVTPAIRDIFRTIGGKPGRKVMDFIEHRDAIVAEAEGVIASEAAKAGVRLQELRLGEAAIPPELMVARLRKQLATQLKATYEEEKLAQRERIAVEKERATANQQPMLVQAELERDAAKFTKDREKTLGEGEKLRMIEVAKGQEAQTAVLGAQIVAELKKLQMTLEFASANPDMVKYPTVLVQSGDGGSSLEGAAAVLGYSNLVNAVTPAQRKEAEAKIVQASR